MTKVANVINSSQTEISKKEVIVVHTAFLGDLLLAIPFFKQLRKISIGTQITLICRKGIGNFFKKLKLIDEYYEIQKGDSKSYNTILQQIKTTSYDLAFCPHQSLRSLNFVRKLNAKVKIGYYQPLSFLVFDHSIRRNKNWPESLRLLQLLGDLPLKTPWVDFVKNEMTKLKQTNFNEKKELQLPKVPEFASLNCVKELNHFYSKSEISIIDRFVNDLSTNERSVSGQQVSGREVNEQLVNGQLVNGQQVGELQVNKLPIKTVCVFPGSVWNTKRWPEGHYTELIQKLLFLGGSLDGAFKVRVVLMGGPGEEELSQKIYNEVLLKEKSGASVSNNFIELADFTGKTSILESANILLQSDLVVANDSASAHLACVTDRPVLTFFGPTVLGFGYRPWGDQVYVLENERLRCRPCSSHGPQKCPIKTHECMKSLSSEMAFQVVKRILSKSFV